MDLIGAVTSQLGISAPAAEGAVGSVLSLIKQHAPADAFAAVEAKAPEVKQWVASAPAAGGDAGGGGGALGALGGLGGLVGGLAGSAGPLAALTGSLSSLGLNAGSLSQLVPLVLQFVKAKAGDGVVSKLMGAVPFLSQLGGGAGGGGGEEGGGGLGGVLGGLGGLLK